MENYVIHLFDGKQKSTRHISFDRFINIGDSLRFDATPETTFVVIDKTFVVDFDDKVVRVDLQTRPKS
ncbi:hypothetical protein [Pseudomonas vanderleydeniana]|uniref:Uncharacterized protein n=1 Tax=Pseudomonas vanderleydeniana TaxID=2745495 RepID=A0A9E6PG19_9PSED|nr:hypothetical protein [Pseudomonas vanderleydeniana]QXI25854.1 hypothetical protein HU752_017940 [Pseudomonas vanderleydeniana]